MSITLEVRGDATWITMDDGKVNALSMEMLDALDDALEQALQTDSKTIVLCGRPRHFSVSHAIWPDGRASGNYPDYEPMILDFLAACPLTP